MQYLNNSTTVDPNCTSLPLKTVIILQYIRQYTPKYVFYIMSANMVLLYVIINALPYFACINKFDILDI